MFGSKKHAILTTNLIIEVKKYKNEQPYFYLYSPPSIADTVKATETVEKLNSLADLNKEDGWQREYYSVPMTL